MYIRHQSVTVAVIGCIMLGWVSLGVSSSRFQSGSVTLLYSDAVPEPQGEDAPEESSGAGSRAGRQLMRSDVYLNPLAAAWRDLRFLVLLSDRLTPP
ncbi:MAG: hypothetical protein EYR95_16390 [Phormidium sp. SL48-SHIP]|nr:MAG: hypothetical protein EYR95_16390 [Phormidium sp. SL48-SHIP]